MDANSLSEFFFLCYSFAVQSTRLDLQKDGWSMAKNQWEKTLRQTDSIAFVLHSLDSINILCQSVIIYAARHQRDIFQMI